MTMRGERAAHIVVSTDQREHTIMVIGVILGVWLLWGCGLLIRDYIRRKKR